MEASTRILFLLTAANLLLLWCIALLNSVINPWGFFLYLPGLFFIPHLQLIDSYRGIFCLLICGFFQDHFLGHIFGFHGFCLPFLYLIFKEFFHLGKQTSQQIIIFQLMINFGMTMAWTITCSYLSNYPNPWIVSKFLADLLVSSLILIPLSLWHTQFCSKLIDLLAHLSLPNVSDSK